MKTRRDKGIKREKRLLISASFVVPVFSAAVFAYFLLCGQGEVVKMVGVVFVARLYRPAAVEDILAEAHESAADRRCERADRF
jgi:ZIP family zinc transporter